ncbi:MAG: DNA polymerase IV [Lachnospiraceae bacterium]|jgi:DNA polymerase-4|nr:DNA polymerase IV [Lachnospiraceae bacterium]
MERERLIFHIDVNSAFLSWESVYRLKKDKNALDLRTIPSAVGGDAKSRHGVVLAKSTPAKRCGVMTGEPLASAYKKCPDLVVVPSRFDLYIQCSRAMMELLSQYTPDSEKFSIDETFLDMTETIHLFGTPMDTANQIRRRIREELGFTVNIGIAPNKLLAKMASDFEKPDKCHTLYFHELSSKFWPLPVRDLFFVGGAAQKRLTAIGIHTIGQLAACDPKLLKLHLGDKYSALIHQYANGIDDSPVGERDPLNKGYGNSLTLSRDVADLETANQVLLSLCETVGARLRADGVLCNCVCVELKTWDFKVQSHQVTLLSSTDSTSQIYENACQALREFWDLTPVRLIGVRVTKIASDGVSQLSFFDTDTNKKKREFEKAVDQIRSRFGVDSIKRASFLNGDVLVDHAASKKKHLNP